MPIGVDAARFLTKSPTRTALIGAGIGAAANGLRETRPGETRGQAMLRGGLQGGAIAGGASMLGRGYRDARLLNPGSSALGGVGHTLSRMGEGTSRFVKRQIHGVTGAFEHDSIGMMGNARAAEKANLMKLRMADELKHAPSARHAGIVKSHQSDISGVLDEGRRAQDLADAGVTTLPGMAKSLWKKDTRGRALRAMGKTVTDGPGGVAMSLGVPVALAAPSLVKGDESAQGGLSKFQKVRNLGVNVGTGMAFGGLPLVAQMGAGIGVDHGMSKLTRTRPPETPNAVPVGGTR